MSETDLTEKQQQVLALHRENKGPSEIAEVLGITSQGVHGHLKRLRGKGLIEERPGAAVRPPSARGNARVNPSAALEIVRQAAREQVAAVQARQAEIDTEITELRAEKNELGKALTELRKHAGEEA